MNSIIDNQTDIEKLTHMSQVLAHRIPDDLEHDHVRRMLEIQEQQVDQRWKQRIRRVDGVYVLPEEAHILLDEIERKGGTT